MNLRRTFAISRRIAEQFRRDERTLALLFVAPIVILALLGWVIRDQSIPASRVAIVNQAGALAEQGRDRLGTALTEAGLVYVDTITDETAARAALADGDLDVAIVLPATLPDDILGGRSPTIDIITPGVSAAADSARIGELQRAVQSAALGGVGLTLKHLTIYGSPDADFLDTFAPALVGFLVFFLVFVLTGISFLRERIGGTLERLLATPVRRSEIATGYSLGFSFFATLQSILVLIFVLGFTVPSIGPIESFSVGLGVPSAGAPWLAFLVTLLLAVAAVNLGIFLSTFARTELQVVQFIPIVVVPQALLAGIFWPVESLPGILQPIARLLPMTYGIEGLREVLVKGSDLTARTLQIDVLVLVGMGLVLAVLAMATIRREVV